MNTLVKRHQGGDKMTDKIEVKLRLPQEVKEKLQKEAVKQKRSLNNLLEVIIEEYLNTIGDTYDHKIAHTLR